VTAIVDPRQWHGWSRPSGGVTLHVGPVPTRKSIALYSIVGSVMYVHAYFRSEKEARRALSVIEFITGGDPLERGIWAGDDG
jgi:hypothetical protein